MRFLRQSLTGLFLLAVTLGLLIYAGSLLREAMSDRLSEERRKPPARERVFAVQVAEARPETVTPILQVFGQIESRRSLVLRAAAAGPVIELADAMQEGGEVQAGEVLLRIDPAEAEAALERARADLLDAEAEERDAKRGLDLAQADLSAAEEQAALRQKAFERQKGLAERRVVTDTAVETTELAAASARQAVVARRQALAQAEARIDRAATGLARARIALSEAERRRDDTVVRAEFSGTLADVSIVAGGLVNSNEALATLVDAQALEVAFRLSNAQYARLLDDAGKLRPAPVRVSLDVAGIDLTSTGRISRDSALVAEGQSGRLVFATLDNPRGMKPGDFVTVEIEEPLLDRVVRLPAKALGSDGAVLVLGPEDRLQSVPVTLLRRQGDDVLVRGDGLAGARVVQERTPLLGAGIKVRPLDRDAETEAAPQAPETVELSPERRARLVAFVEGNSRMPADAKERMLQALQEPRVPARMVARLESRMGS